jgi:flavin reductase (DIM6/NTAB) family NADH-FMN oxidoreductase RutF
MIVTPGAIATKDFHALLLGSIAPRPICFASTLDENGQPNLSPFSFFNVFGSKPPILVFSPARRVRDNTLKHTLQNIEQTKEVVINVVNYAMVQQQSLASCEYPKGVSEFEKAGFTPLASDLVKPYRVQESPVQLECKVLDIIYTSQEGGAGNLIICEVVRMHINDAVLDEKGQIDPHKIDLVARMGADYYCRASGDAVFEVAKPNLNLGMGMDQLPAGIKKSAILSGNDLAMLANYTTLPVLDTALADEQVQAILTDNLTKEQKITALHQYAKTLLAKQATDMAWQVLLTSTTI